jgi:hypothetical protein
MLKQKSEKWQSFEACQEIILRAKLTAKVLISDMIEGKTPISFLIDQHPTID